MLGQGPSASSGPPPPAKGPTFPEDPLPIDENIILLIAIAILYGIYVAYKKRKAINIPQ